MLLNRIGIELKDYILVIVPKTLPKDIDAPGVFCPLRNTYAYLYGMVFCNMKVIKGDF
jgi:hypothetical protein